MARNDELHKCLESVQKLRMILDIVIKELSVIEANANALLGVGTDNFSRSASVPETDVYISKKKTRTLQMSVINEVLRKAGKPITIREIYDELLRSYDNFFPDQIIHRVSYLTRLLSLAAEEGAIVETVNFGTRRLFGLPENKRY